LASSAPVGPGAGGSIGMAAAGPCKPRDPTIGRGAEACQPQGIAANEAVAPIREACRSRILQEAARAMSVGLTTDDDDRLATANAGGGGANGLAASNEGVSEASQAAWFGLSEDERPASGVYAGVVFNRPIEQVLTYRVPVRLAGLIRVGQR